MKVCEQTQFMHIERLNPGFLKLRGKTNNQDHF